MRCKCWRWRRLILCIIFCSKFVVHSFADYCPCPCWYQSHCTVLSKSGRNEFVIKCMRYRKRKSRRYLNAMRPISGRFVGFSQTENGRLCVRLNVRYEDISAGHHCRRVVVHFGAHKHWRHQLHGDAVRWEFLLNGQRKVFHINLLAKKRILIKNIYSAYLYLQL